MQEQEFKTIDDIKKARAKVRIIAGIQKEEIREMWHGMMHPEKKEPKTKTEKILSYADKASVFVDGAMLGWKLFKKIKGIKKKR